MEPIFKEINETHPLLGTVNHNGQSYTAVTINKLIFRPVLKRVVFVTQEFDRVVVYEGEEYNSHTGDTNSTLITVLLDKIAATYTGTTN